MIEGHYEAREQQLADEYAEARKRNSESERAKRKLALSLRRLKRRDDSDGEQEAAYSAPTSPTRNPSSPREEFDTSVALLTADKIFVRIFLADSGTTKVIPVEHNDSGRSIGKRLLRKLCRERHGMIPLCFSFLCPLLYPRLLVFNVPLSVLGRLVASLSFAVPLN